jgi:hypothetical protein
MCLQHFEKLNIKKSEKTNKLVTKAHKTLQQKLYECVIERGNNRK